MKEENIFPSFNPVKARNSKIVTSALSAQPIKGGRVCLLLCYKVIFDIF